MVRRESLTTPKEGILTETNNYYAIIDHRATRGGSRRNSSASPPRSWRLPRRGARPQTELAVHTLASSKGSGPSLTDDLRRDQRGRGGADHRAVPGQVGGGGLATESGRSQADPCECCREAFVGRCVRADASRPPTMTQQRSPDWRGRQRGGAAGPAGRGRDSERRSRAAHGAAPTWPSLVPLRRGRHPQASGEPPSRPRTPLARRAGVDAEPAEPVRRVTEEPDQRSVPTHDLTRQEAAISQTPPGPRQPATRPPTGRSRPRRGPDDRLRRRPARTEPAHRPDASQRTSGPGGRYSRTSRNSGNTTKNAGHKSSTHPLTAAPTNPAPGAPACKALEVR